MADENRNMADDEEPVIMADDEEPFENVDDRAWFERLTSLMVKGIPLSFKRPPPPGGLLTSYADNRPWLDILDITSPDDLIIFAHSSTFDQHRRLLRERATWDVDVDADSLDDHVLMICTILIFVACVDEKDLYDFDQLVDPRDADPYQPPREVFDTIFDGLMTGLIQRQIRSLLPEYVEEYRQILHMPDDEFTTKYPATAAHTPSAKSKASTDGSTTSGRTVADTASNAGTDGTTPNEITTQGSPGQQRTQPPVVPPAPTPNDTNNSDNGVSASRGGTNATHASNSNNSTSGTTTTDQGNNQANEIDLISEMSNSTPLRSNTGSNSRNSYRNDAEGTLQQIGLEWSQDALKQIRLDRDITTKNQVKKRYPMSYKVTWDGQPKTFTVWDNKFKAWLYQEGMSYILNDDFVRMYVSIPADTTDAPVFGSKPYAGWDAVHNMGHVREDEITYRQFKNDQRSIYGQLQAVLSNITEKTRFFPAQSFDGVRSYYALRDHYTNRDNARIILNDILKRLHTPCTPKSGQTVAEWLERRMEAYAEYDRRRVEFPELKCRAYNNMEKLSQTLPLINSSSLNDSDWNFVYSTHKDETRSKDPSFDNFVADIKTWSLEGERGSVHQQRRGHLINTDDMSDNYQATGTDIVERLINLASRPRSGYLDETAIEVLRRLLPHVDNPLAEFAKIRNEMLGTPVPTDRRQDSGTQDQRTRANALPRQGNASTNNNAGRQTGSSSDLPRQYGNLQANNAATADGPNAAAVVP